MAQVQICDYTSKGEVLLKKFALLYVCRQPPSILKHSSVAMSNLFESRYGQLTTNDIFSSFSCMHTKFEVKPSQAKPYHTQLIILFS